MRNLILICIIAQLCGCSVTHRLERKQIGANAKFIPKEEEKKKLEERKAFFEVKQDSGSYFLVPTSIDENGDQIMSIDIDEVVVFAKVKALPERKGKVSIDFIVTLPKELQGNCQGVTLTPWLHKSEGSQPLEDITIRGGLFDKVQSRNYWQYEQYLRLFNPDSLESVKAFDRFVRHPYPEGVRLDSIIEKSSTITYFYTQDVETKGEGKKLLVTLNGRVNGLDGSYYELPPSDTLQYNISSMLTFADTTTHYIQRIIEKYAVVNDKNYLSFNVASSEVIDTLGDNKAQLSRIESLMDQLINQYEYHVDSVILTASASPDGGYALNEKFALQRAQSLKERLVEKFGSDVDTLITVRSVGEGWTELKEMIAKSDIGKKEEILSLFESEKNLDVREWAIMNRFPVEYKQIKEKYYPLLRSVSFKYDLRRVGMLQDTIYTTEVDTLYHRGVELLNERKYSEAFNILNEYKDHNCALAMMSLGYDQGAYEILCEIPQNDMTYYLRAILCSRLGLIDEGRRCFLESCNLNSRMEYRGKLDPEISNLLIEE